MCENGQMILSNKQIAEFLDEVRHLMDLNGENVFKVRAFEKASDLVSELSADEDLYVRAKNKSLTELAGIGKGISEVLTEYLLTGKSKVREELEAALPVGLMELTEIPGLGPKRARQLIDELDIHSVGELEYACRENRILKLKGFGEKAQHKILEGIQFLATHRGQRRLDDAFPVAKQLLETLLQAVNHGRHPVPDQLRVSEAGALRRRLETLSELEFLIEIPAGVKHADELRSRSQTTLEKFLAETKFALPVHLHFASPEKFGFELAKLTGSKEHWHALGNPEPFDARTEEDFYTRLKLPVIPPESRETGEEVSLARSGGLMDGGANGLLPWDGVRGVFHNHTTRSDGRDSLEDMVIAAKKCGYAYIGISDHSQSAFYAQGLKSDALLEQEKEIRALQEKHPDIRIFWGIESDILADGDLDYDAKMLKRFDFVVASVHSRFQMEKEAMTDRILTAIRHPATRFLGHATGRILLGRKGYDLHMEKVIAEAARCNVAIEINANPARLDIDWRWGKELRASKTLVSVNPDAHDVAGLSDTIYGIAVARKALLPTGLVVNSRSVQEVEKWLKRL